ncbi:helix-turn-helix domain-containing protein [Aminobacter aminovorans]|uniref:Transcriptional regulator with XRE-family HTH domain n=1 Tax=Aminobacter aminovorans TaxID=83263 RepID=A0AAC8YN33_AMIAI|nr:helix-turn-helix transcriptional regulator [Aminobacter aminovorans]AMS41198.1 hypothetical protein AA2016_2270 [Aminobacter aminovorans]MBB3705819.1 transcriptional regulator with XRE-family HTH domain [Aminobacter aminovorans]
MKLSAWKLKNGLSDEQLAEMIGDCSVSGLRKWLAEERLPRKDQIERIHKVTRGEVSAPDFYNLELTTETEVSK